MCVTSSYCCKLRQLAMLRNLSSSHLSASISLSTPARKHLYTWSFGSLFKYSLTIIKTYKHGEEGDAKYHFARCYNFMIPLVIWGIVSGLYLENMGKSAYKWYEPSDIQGTVPDANPLSVFTKYHREHGVQYQIISLCKIYQKEVHSLGVTFYSMYDIELEITKLCEIWSGTFVNWDRTIQYNHDKIFSFISLLGLNILSFVFHCVLKYTLRLSA